MLMKIRTLSTSIRTLTKWISRRTKANGVSREDNLDAEDGAVMEKTELKAEADIPSPETVIFRIRQSHPDMARIFTEGGCYSMFLILASIFPGAVAYYDGSHIWTWIEDDFYDINGRMQSDEELRVLCRLPRPDNMPSSGPDGWGMSNEAWYGA